MHVDLFFYDAVYWIAIISKFALIVKHILFIEDISIMQLSKFIYNGRFDTPVIHTIMQVNILINCHSSNESSKVIIVRFSFKCQMFAIYDELSGDVSNFFSLILL